METRIIETVNGWDNTVELMTEVKFLWSMEHGECHECGLPAAFYAPEAYGDVRPPNDTNKLCSVCAANAAADGERILRISEE